MPEAIGMSSDTAGDGGPGDDNDDDESGVWLGLPSAPPTSRAESAGVPALTKGVAGMTVSPDKSDSSPPSILLPDSWSSRFRWRQDAR